MAREGGTLASYYMKALKMEGIIKREKSQEENLFVPRWVAKG